MEIEFTSLPFPNQYACLPSSLFLSCLLIVLLSIINMPAYLPLSFSAAFSSCYFSYSVGLPSSLSQLPSHRVTFPNQYACLPSSLFFGWLLNVLGTFPNPYAYLPLFLSCLLIVLLLLINMPAYLPLLFSVDFSMCYFSYSVGLPSSLFCQLPFHSVTFPIQ